MPETPTPPPSPTRRILGLLLRPLLFVFATIYFLIDDVVLAIARPLWARLAELRLFARLGAAIERLPPYPTLVLFLVPFVVLEPFKLWGLWLLGTGSLAAGATMLAIAHLTSILLVERLFHATRDKLLTIGWFARIHGWVSALYDWSLGRLRATAAWRAAAVVLAGLRATLRGLRIALIAAIRPIIVLGRRFVVRLSRLARS